MFLFSLGFCARCSLGHLRRTHRLTWGAGARLAVRVAAGHEESPQLQWWVALYIVFAANCEDHVDVASLYEVRQVLSLRKRADPYANIEFLEKTEWGDLKAFFFLLLLCPGWWNRCLHRGDERFGSVIQSIAVCRSIRGMFGTLLIIRYRLQFGQSTQRA